MHDPAHRRRDADGGLWRALPARPLKLVPSSQ